MWRTPQVHYSPLPFSRVGVQTSIVVDDESEVSKQRRKDYLPGRIFMFLK
jgi:hypothetical protein